MTDLLQFWVILLWENTVNVQIVDLMFGRGSSAGTEDACGVDHLPGRAWCQRSRQPGRPGSDSGPERKQTVVWRGTVKRRRDPQKHKPAATLETQLDDVSASACLWGSQRSVSSSVFICKVLSCKGQKVCGQERAVSAALSPPSLRFLTLRQFTRTPWKRERTAFVVVTTLGLSWSDSGWSIFQRSSRKRLFKQCLF